MKAQLTSRYLTGALALLLCSACVSTNVTLLGKPTPRSVIPEDDVIIYRTADQVPGTRKSLC